MSKIQIAELKKTNSELNLLDSRETSAVVGGYGYGYGSYGYGKARQSYLDKINIATIVQINNNINVQLNFGGGDNINLASLTNNAGANQS